MPGQIRHVFTNAVPDGTATSIVRPSDWNSEHAFTLQDAVSILTAGNTAGVIAAITSGTVFLAGGNNITLSQNGNSVTVSGPTVPAQTVQPGLQSLSAGTTRVTTGQVVFSNSNGVSFGVDGQTVTATVKTDYLTTAALSNHSHGNPTLHLTNLSGTTDSNSAGFTLSLSAAAPGGGGLTNIRISAGTTSNLLSAVTFSNSNGISFGLDASTVTASHNGLTSQSNQALSGSNGSFAFQTATFGNLNGVSFYTSNGSLVASYTVPTQTVESQSIGMSTQTAGGATAGTTGYASGGQVLYHFVPGSNITMSQSVNGASGTLSIYAPTPGGGAGFTRSRFNPFMEAVGAEGQIGQGTIHLHPVPDNEHFQFDRMYFDVRVTQATNTNSSGTATVSFWAGFYTRNGSSLSLYASSSTTQSIVKSGTAQSTNYQGPRVLTMGWTTTITQNDYWLGILSRTTTGGANLNTISQYLASDLASNFSGVVGLGSNATNQNVLGLGIYTATTSAMPGSIAFSQIQGTASQYLRVPLYYFISQSA